jgi:hypothetical protein
MLQKNEITHDYLFRNVRTIASQLCSGGCRATQLPYVTASKVQHDSCCISAIDEVSQFRNAVWGSGMMFVELRRTRILTKGNSQFVLNLKSDT